MTRIAYILLCHKDAESIIRQAERLTAAGDFVAIHLDARAPRAAYASLRQALADNPNVVFARRRLRCGRRAAGPLHGSSPSPAPERRALTSP